MARLLHRHQQRLHLRVVLAPLQKLDRSQASKGAAETTKGLLEAGDALERAFGFGALRYHCHVQLHDNHRHDGRTAREHRQRIDRTRRLICDPLLPVAEDSSSALGGGRDVHAYAAVDHVDRMRLHRELCDNAEVAAGSLEAPQEVGVFTCILETHHGLATGQDNLGGDKIVDGHSVQAREIAAAARN